MQIKKVWIPILLFILTLISTLYAGALQKGVNIFSNPCRIIEGLPFSLSLMAILLTHELSHYFTSKKHHTATTLPYFIPAPSIIGTFGAFIKMKAPIISRTALVDISSSGPIAGFIVALTVTIYGLQFSELALPESTQGGLILGDSILFSLLSNIIVGTPPGGKDILLHPVAFAGWIGLFVTAMNLLPIGQLDGGHIAYSLFGRKNHKRLSLILATVLAVIGITRLYLYNDFLSFPFVKGLENYLWEGWAIWAFLLFMLGLNHPPVYFWEKPLSGSRKFIGWLSLFIFIITFTPVPFKIV